MEKSILVYLNRLPKEYLSVKKTTTINSIKKYLEKYGDVKVQMFVNSKNELKVFDTDKYDNMSLESVWKNMNKPKIYLTSYIKQFTGNRDIDILILSKVENVKELLQLCSTNKYLYGLCNEDFWKNKAINLGGNGTIKYKNRKESWKKHFLQMVMDLDYIREAMEKEIETILEDEELSSEEIENFFTQKNDKIEGAIKKMYLDYREDGELNELKTAEPDWFREYLFDDDFLSYENILSE